MLRVCNVWNLALGLCKIELVSASTLERRLNGTREGICHVGLCITVAVGTLESIPDRSPSDVAGRPPLLHLHYTLPTCVVPIQATNNIVRYKYMPSGTYTGMGHTEKTYTSRTNGWSIWCMWETNLLEWGESWVLIWIHTWSNDHSRGQHPNKKLANPKHPQQTHHLMHRALFYVSHCISSCQASIGTQLTTREGTDAYWQ